MPASVAADPLAVRFVFPDGTESTANLDGLPNPRLAADLARGLPELTHPHGGIATRHTAGQYTQALRGMVTDLAGAGFTGGAADLTRPALLRYWMAVSHIRERYSRRLLAGFDTVTGALDPGVRAHLDGRQLHLPTPQQPLQPYTEQQWAQLRTCCETIAHDIWTRHTVVLAAAGRGADPRTAGPSEDNLAWLMLRCGPLTVAEVARHLDDGRQQSAASPVGAVREALFPSRDVQIAHQLLFGVYTGIVPDGIADLGLGDIEWAGDTTVLLRYVKGRAGPEGLNLPVRAVRLLRRWLRLSQPLRRFAPPPLRDQLWISCELNNACVDGRFLGRPTRPRVMRAWAEAHGLLPDTGLRVPIHRARIRTTYHNLLARRGWTGRTTIDPNHTATIEGDHYLTATTPAQQDAVEAIIEQGQSDLLRKALPAVVLSDEQTAELAAFPQTVARLGLDEPAMAELVGGPRDVFLAACADQLAGLHGPAGKPCPARPWVCLLCPLAVFLPRHAPNLLRLKAFFARQFRQMTTDEFVRVFGPYANRLDSEILPRFDPKVLAHAATGVGDHNDELPLRAEETT